MRLLVAVTAVLLVQLGSSQALLSEHPAPPKELESMFSPTRPAWRSVEMIVDQDGQLKRQELPFVLRIRLERAAANTSATEKTCVEVENPVGDPPPGLILPNSFSDLCRNALAIFHGEVVAIQQGLFNGEPGQLLQVKVTEAVKPARQWWQDDYVYVYYPSGTFPIGDLKICKNDQRWPEAPEVGDLVLLFPHRAPIDVGGTTINLDPEGYELILEKKDGIILPHRLRYDAGLLSTGSLDQAGDSARKILSMGGKGQ